MLDLLKSEIFLIPIQNQSLLGICIMEQLIWAIACVPILAAVTTFFRHIVCD